MRYQIEVHAVEPRLLAAVRRQLQPSEAGSAWREALDLVWAFVRTQDGLWSGGHNVFVYREGPAGAPLTVDFGVEVTRPFQGNGIVVPAETPGGRVVVARHVGPLRGLPDAYAAIDSWFASNAEVPRPVSWETYGDWGPDPATWEVSVSRLLA